MKSPHSPILSYFFVNSEPRILRLALILGGVLVIGFGLALNVWFKAFYFPKELYFLLGMISLWIGVLSQLSQHIKKYIFDYAFIVFVLGYLAIIFLTFRNNMQFGTATILVATQILFAISFRNIVEYTIFAIVSLIIFIACSLLILKPGPDIYLFIGSISVSTVVAGIYVWMRERSYSRIIGNDPMLEELLDNSIFAIFLLDANCESILYHNKIASRYLYELYGDDTINAPDLFELLGLKADYVVRRFRIAEPDLQEKSYFTFTREDKSELEFEIYISQVHTLGQENLLLKIRDITDLKYQERELSRSMSVNESLLSAIPDVLITIDVNGFVQSIRSSQDFQSKLRFEDFLGKHFSVLAGQVMSATKQKEAEHLLAMARSKSKLAQTEFLTIWENGNRHYDLRVVPLEDMQEILAIIRDITDSKEVELALKQSEQNYREIFNTGTDGMMILEPEHLSISDVNQVACEMLGFSKQEIEQISITGLVKSPAPEAFITFLNGVIQGENSRLESTMLKKDGQEFQAELTAKLAILGGEFRLLLSMRNIVERVEFLRQIKSQALLVENVSEAIISTKPDFTILSWNPAAEAIYGWKREEAIGKVLDDLIPGDFVSHTRAEAMEAIFQNRFWQGEIIQQDKYKRKIHVQSSATLMADIQDEDPTIVVLSRDITVQKEREKQLKKSEQKFKELFNSSSEGIFVKNLDGVVLDANPAACKLYKGNIEELKGKKITELTPTRHREAIAGAYAAMIMGQLHYLESYFLNREKEIIPIEMRASRFDLEGSPAMIIHVSDISQRKVAEERLRLFRSLINQSSDSIFVLDSDSGNLADFNEQMAMSLGYTHDEIRNLHISRFNTQSGQQAIPEHVLKEIESAGSAIYMTRHMRKDGSTFPVEVNLGSVLIGQKSYLVGIARDITDRLYQEEALRQSEQKYRTLVEKMNEGLILTDNDETILFVNNRVCEILGLSKQELVGQRSYDVLGGGDVGETIKDKSTLRLQGISDQYELQLSRKNGDLIWALVAGAPYIDSNGDSIGTIAIITNITDRKATEIKLQEKNNELDAFVYKASHDLKGPLASIMGVTNIARDEVKDPEANRYFDLISKSTERLDVILSELLDVTRINKAKINYEPINVSFMIEDIINSIRHLPKSVRVDFQQEVNISNGFESDKKLLTSILQNLIVNSINYQNPHANPPFVRITVEEKFDKLVFSISDNGQGIPKRMQDKVFEMFYRGNTQSKGSGLGLYIVKNSIEKLQGTVQLNSIPGEGTTFSFTLPNHG